MTPRFHPCGSGAFLMDVSTGPFDLGTQKRLWSLAAGASPVRAVAGVRGLVLGVNNLLVRFDALRADPLELHGLLGAAWEAAQPLEASGKSFEVAVTYDTAPGSELEGIAAQAGLSVAEVVRLHSGADYHVACIGSVPGFAYLVGLPPELATPRRQTPSARVHKGSVVIGGAQAGVIPMDMPSGWHVLGRTELAMFDPTRDPPSLFAPGDRVRFTVRGGTP